MSGTGNATQALGVQVLGHVLGIAAMPMPPQPWVGLCLIAPPPTDTTGGAELGAGGAYARIQANFALASGGIALANNTQSITYAAATADWGAVGYFELWDAAAGGNRLFWGILVDPASGQPTPRTILQGDQARFAVGALAVTVTSS
jgi:hypothetical protein